MASVSNLLQLFSCLEDYDVLVNQVPTWERRLSSLLGDMKILFDEESPSVSVTEYLNYLYRAVSSLRRGLLETDAPVTIQPGEFKDFTTRILRYVLSHETIKKLSSKFQLIVESYFTFGFFVVDWLWLC